MTFRTEERACVSVVIAEQMRQADRISVGEFGLDMLQMMANAGRSLAGNVLAMAGGVRGEVALLDSNIDLGGDRKDTLGVSKTVK